MKIIIDLIDYQRIFKYVDSVQSEIIGIAKVKTLGEFIKIYDVSILDQEVTNGSATIDQESKGAFAYEVMKNGGDISEYKCVWHSHCEMEVFWSSIDDAMIEDWNTDFLVSIVVNKSRDIRCRLDIYKPFLLTLDNLEMETLYPPLPESEKTFISQEIEKKVTKKAITIPDKYFGSWNPDENFPSCKDEDEEILSVCPTCGKRSEYPQYCLYCDLDWEIEEEDDDKLDF